MILKTDKYIEKLNKDLKKRVEKLENTPLLYLIRVGDDKGSLSYEKSIYKEAKKININVKTKVFNNDSNEDEIIDFIETLNRDVKVSGILVFVPLCKKFSQKKILNSISSKKDVDGLNEESISKVIYSKDYHNLPTTALSTLEYLKSITNLESKDVLIINRSLVVGKPLSLMMINEGATVQIAHSKTKNLNEKIASSDIVISAIGKKEILDTDDFKDDAIVIDLGYSIEDNNIYGDFCFDKLKDLNIKYLPSVGGIGKINSNMIIKNTIRNEEINEGR